MINDQETNLWLEEKWGKMSGSQLFHIMVPGKEYKLFSPGGLTYIENVARERFTRFNTDENVETYAMKMGKVNEAQSFYAISKKLGFNGLTYHGGGNPVFELYNGYGDPLFDGRWGVSPDSSAITSGGKCSFGMELKNPKQATHLFYLRNVRDQWDLKKVSLEYYTQTQASMMAMDCDLWLWGSYNEYFPEAQQARVIECAPDKNFQADLKIRAKQAIRLIDQLVEEWQSL